MKHNVKNAGASPTFVHVLAGLVTIEPGATASGLEFNDTELAAVKGNESLHVSDFEEPKAEQPDPPKPLTKKEQKALDEKREEAASLGVLFDMGDSADDIAKKIDAKLAE